jgi:hypothetical protein
MIATMHELDDGKDWLEYTFGCSDVLDDTDDAGFDRLSDVDRKGLPPRHKGCVEKPSFDAAVYLSHIL